MLLDEHYPNQIDVGIEKTPSSRPSKRGKSKSRILSNIIVKNANDETLTISHSSPGDIIVQIVEPSLQYESSHVSSRNPHDVAQDVKPYLDEMIDMLSKLHSFKITIKCSLFHLYICQNTACTWDTSGLWLM